MTITGPSPLCLHCSNTTHLIAAICNLHSTITTRASTPPTPSCDHHCLHGTITTTHSRSHNPHHRHLLTCIFTLTRSPTPTQSPLPTCTIITIHLHSHNHHYLLTRTQSPSPIHTLVTLTNIITITRPHVAFTSVYLHNHNHYPCLHNHIPSRCSYYHLPTLAQPPTSSPPLARLPSPTCTRVVTPTISLPHNHRHLLYMHHHPLTHNKHHHCHPPTLLLSHLHDHQHLPTLTVTITCPHHIITIVCAHSYNPTCLHSQSPSLTCIYIFTTIDPCFV
jgi:hypothetical protein